MDEKSTVKHKSILFAKRIKKLYKHLCSEKKEFVMSKQLLSCGTSIGITRSEYNSIKQDCDELMKTLTAITKTTRYSLLTTHS